MKVLFSLFLLLIKEIISLRYTQTWDNLFRSNARGKYKSENEMKDRIDQYSSTISSHKLHSFIVKYPENCGIDCHEKIELQVKKHSSRNHYSIIDAEHALIYTDLSTIKSLHTSNLDIFTDHIPFIPELKIDSEVNIDKICSTNTNVTINVVFLPNDFENTQELQTFFATECKSATYSQHDLEAFQSKKENLLPVSFPCNVAHETLQILSHRYDVQWIEIFQQPSLRLRWANGLAQSGKYQKTPLFHANLTGHAHIIGIADTGIDSQSCFFIDPNNDFPYGTVNMAHRKVITYISPSGGDKLDGSGHGTSVAGVSAGYCNDPKSNYYNYYGAAYNSKIAFMDIGTSSSSDVTPPSNYYTGIFQPLYQVGSKVQSMSWGSSSNSYTAQARYIDQFMWDFKDSLIIIAAGNTGGNGSNTVGTPATNKNGIAAGASLNDEQSWNAVGKVSTKSAALTKSGLASFSSRGPTADGRLKPEICAVGNNIGAAEYNQECSVANRDGTSFSSPLIAGYATLVRQYFMDGFYPSGFKNVSNSFIPSGALIKAILVHSGQALDYITDGEKSVTTRWGDNNQGYGRIQLSNALSFNVPATLNGLTMFVRGSVGSTSPYYVEFTKTGEVHVYNFTARSDATTTIRVTLAYTDYFGTIGSTKALVNDLDLTVQNSTKKWTPLVTNSVDINTGAKYDSRNNLEFIAIHPNPGGHYTVTVKARSISRAQPYSLVITGQVGQYTYSDKYNGVDSGLTQKAKIFVLVAAILAFCFTICVIWLAFGRAARRNRINQAMEMYRRANPRV